MSKEIDLDAIEARANAATPGPWKYVGTTPGRGSCFEFNGVCGFMSGPEGEFIAHAREDVPKLLAAHRALVARVRELEQALEKAKDIGEFWRYSESIATDHAEQLKLIARLPGGTPTK